MSSQQSGLLQEQFNLFLAEHAKHASGQEVKPNQQKDVGTMPVRLSNEFGQVIKGLAATVRDTNKALRTRENPLLLQFMQQFEEFLRSKKPEEINTPDFQQGLQQAINQLWVMVFKEDYKSPALQWGSQVHAVRIEQQIHLGYVITIITIHYEQSYTAEKCGYFRGTSFFHEANIASGAITVSSIPLIKDSQDIQDILSDPECKSPEIVRILQGVCRSRNAKVDGQCQIVTRLPASNAVYISTLRGGRPIIIEFNEAGLSDDTVFAIIDNFSNNDLWKSSLLRLSVSAHPRQIQFQSRAIGVKVPSQKNFFLENQLAAMN